MSDDTKALVERAREVAGYKYQHHTIHVPVVLDMLADTIERLERDRDALADHCEKLREDAARLDVIERCIRDGSYRSILNDIIAFCEHSYANFGSGPALRSAIDGCLVAPKDAP